MKILAFAASNSSESINRRLALHVARRIPGAEVESLNLNDFDMPIFSEQREMAGGTPAAARSFHERIAQADALVIGFAEHNGTYTAAWKNLLDWTSRIDRRFLQQKPSIYVATSPGGGGASSVLSQAVNSAPHFGGEVVASVSVPQFNDAYVAYMDRIRNRDIETQIAHAVDLLSERLGVSGALLRTGS